MNCFKLTLLFSVLLTSTLFAQNHDADFEKLEKQIYDDANYEEALILANKLVKSSPENGYAHFMLGECYYGLHDAENAHANYDKATKLLPDDILALYQRTVVKQFLARSLKEICPDFERLKQMMAEQEDYEYLLDKISWEGLCELANKLKSADDFVATAQDFAMKDEIPEAMVLFGTAIEIDPNNDEAYYGLAICYIKLNDDRKFHSMLIKSIESNPKNADANRTMAIYYAAQGEYEKSMEYTQIAARLGDKPSQERLTEAGLTW